MPPIVDMLCLLYFHVFEIQLSTPDDYYYEKWFEVDQRRKCVEFSVKAENDAHIALGCDKEHSGKHWEIVIGGWNNCQSVMRKENQ